MNRLNIISWVVVILCQGLLLIGQANLHRNLQQEIAEDILRFHVRANSDSTEDQELKLAVRDAVVAYVKELTDEATTKAQVKKIIRSNLPAIENVAKGVIIQHKKEYNVRAYFETAYFPVKEYGDFIFPAGNYEAFRIDIGSAAGKNWWCVIYPKLCFLDINSACAGETAMEELGAVLDEEELSMVAPKQVKFTWESGIMRLLKRTFKIK